MRVPRHKQNKTKKAPGEKAKHQTRLHKELGLPAPSPRQKWTVPQQQPGESLQWWLHLPRGAPAEAALLGFPGSLYWAWSNPSWPWWHHLPWLMSFCATRWKGRESRETRCQEQFATGFTSPKSFSMGQQISSCFGKQPPWELVCR